jgi:TolB-like protein
MSVSRWLVAAAMIMALGSLGVNWMRQQKRPILAIIPFDVRSGTADEVTLRMALAESLTASLAGRRDAKVRVIGPSTTFHYDKQTPMDVLRQDLNAAEVMSGGLEIGTDSITVFAQLLRTSDRTHLWGKRFRIAIQDVDSLVPRLTREILSGAEPKMVE